MGASRSFQMPSLEEQIQPHMESSTEAMDTDEGQRTTARLLEEARRLSESTMEPTYATIDEPKTTRTGGSLMLLYLIY